LNVLLEQASEHRLASRLLAAEVLYRAALRVNLGTPGATPQQLSATGDAGDPDAAAPPAPAAAAPSGVWRAWLGLADTLLERGHAMGARMCFRRAVERAREEDLAAGGVADAERETRLFGLSELFLATDGLAELRGAGGPGSASGASAVRAAHVALYYRSTIAAERRDWGVVAALGEFYRLVGCPRPSLDGPVPDVPTALSYFEQARAMAPNFFSSARIAVLADEGSAAAS